MTIHICLQMFIYGEFIEGLVTEGVTWFKQLSLFKFMFTPPNSYRKYKKFTKIQTI